MTAVHQKWTNERAGWGGRNFIGEEDVGDNECDGPMRGLDFGRSGVCVCVRAFGRCERSWSELEMKGIQGKTLL